MTDMVRLYKPCPMCAPEPDVPGRGCVACNRTGYAPHGAVPACEDHPILDFLDAAMSTGTGLIADVSRESECVEFKDVETGRRYEIVVREIGRDDQGESTP